MNKLKKFLKILKTKKPDLILYYTLKGFKIKVGISPYPELLIIEPTNACNLKCPTCPTGAGKLNRPKKNMSLSQFQNIINQSKGYINKILLCNYGEPFLHKDINKMINYAHKNKISVDISTNGEFFSSKNFCEQVIKSGLDNLIICLDGLDQPTIDKYRKGSNINNLLTSLKNITQAKKELKTKTPNINLQFIIMKHNQHQKDKVKEIALKYGADSYSTKTVGINYNDPDFQKLAKEFIPKNETLSRYEKNNKGEFILKGTVKNNCIHVNLSTVINSDGTIVPCCYDQYSNHIMGNVFKEPLKKIWNNSKYTNFRKQITNNRKKIPMCNICSEGRYDITNSVDVL